MRRPGHRPERLASARGDPAPRTTATWSSTSARRTGSRWMQAGEGARRSRTARASLSARPRSSFRGRRAEPVPVASAQVGTALLILKIAFLVILYLFIWRIVRSAARDLRLPQESMILSPQQASVLLAQPLARELGRLIVVESGDLDEGDEYASTRPRSRSAGATTTTSLWTTSTPRPVTRGSSPPRRRLCRGRRLDQRNVRERDPPRQGPAPRARGRRPDRRDRPEVRAMRISHGSARGDRTPAASAGTTRTTSSSSRRCSRSRTAWVVRRRASSPRRSPPGRCASATDPAARAEEQVVELIQEANRRVHERAMHDAAASGMGTTMTVAVFDGDGSVTIGHVGDSRAYLLRDRAARAADRGPLARRRARASWRALGQGGRDPSAALGDHARARYRSRRRRRRVPGPGARRATSSCSARTG